MGEPYEDNVQFQIAKRRGNLAKGLIEQWRTVADRRYHVVRGFVSFETWDFERYPYVVAIQFEAVRFQSTTFNDCIAIFEIMNSQKYELKQDEALTENFSDTGLDSIYFDAAWVFNNLCGLVDDNGSSVVQNIKYNEIVGREVHDPANTVQGVIVRAPIVY